MSADWREKRLEAGVKALRDYQRTHKPVRDWDLVEAVIAAVDAEDDARAMTGDGTLWES